MNQRIFGMLVFAGSLVSVSNLLAQDNRKADTNQPTLEDRIAQLEQDDQSLKNQVDQLQNDLADLQDRVRRLEGGKPPPPAARSSETNQTARSGKARQESSEETASYDVFYQRLQSGGRWFDDPTYGKVWQPDLAASDRSWRPYSDGHWAYTDRGWTWISNENFGWATYHYGRWVRRADNGWIWIPGSKWAPAWVSWRESNDHVGWAPLPPEVSDDSRTEVGEWVDSYYDIGPAAYSFVSIRDLARPTYRDVILPPSEDAVFFSETRNVTNIAYDGDLVAVKGPRYERIESQARIPSYTLNYVTENQGRFAINTRGNQLEVLAPPATLQRNSSTQPQVEKTLTRAQVDRGWQNVDRQKAAQLRQAAAQQAQIPANLPPKPVTQQSPATETENQPPRSDQTQKPAAGQASPQGRVPSTPPPATPAPEVQQPSSPKNPPTSESTPERERQAGPANEVNPDRTRPDQPAKPPVQSERAPNRQEPGPENSPSSSPAKVSPAGSPLPVERSQQPPGPIEKREQPGKSGGPSSEDLKDQPSAPPKKQPPQERSNLENRSPDGQMKEPSGESRKEIHRRREEPSNDGASATKARENPPSGEPVKNDKSDQSRKEPDGERRVQQKHSQPSDTEPRKKEKKEQKQEEISPLSE